MALSYDVKRIDKTWNNENFIVLQYEDNKLLKCERHKTIEDVLKRESFLLDCGYIGIRVCDGP